MSPIDRIISVCRAFLFAVGGEITTHEFIKINDLIAPAPARGLNFIVATTVTAGRNANNEVVGQKVGRDQYKIDNLFWPHLTAAVWSSLLQEFAKFKVSITFPDMVNNKWITLWMYPGDRTATPFKVSKETGLPTEYINCKCNVVDFGVIDG